MQKFKVEKEQRLDIFLSQILNQSRSQIANFIKKAQILINEKSVTKPGFRLKIGDELSLSLNENLDENLNFVADLNLNENLKENIKDFKFNSNLNLNEKINLKKNLSSNEKLNLNSHHLITKNLKLNLNPFNEQDSSKQDFVLEILFEDEDILVINKPPNLVVHGAPSVKEPTLVDILLAKNYALSTLGGKLRAGLVHRLDKGTSGALIIAKNNAAHTSLSKQLEDKSLGRIYLALCDLPLKEDFIRVEKAIIRSTSNRLKKLALASNLNAPKHAKIAISSFANLLTSTKDKTSLIAAKLFTGRTHQIRAHLESLNRHILGDELYNYKGKFKGRVMLHSRVLYFLHPKSQKNIFVKAPFYDDFYKILQKHFAQGEIDEKSSTEYLCKLFT